MSASRRKRPRPLRGCGTIGEMEPFLLPADLMRRRRGVKWRRHAEEVLPAWVADRDFAVAEPVQRAIARVVDEQDYGYPDRAGADCLEEAFAARMRDRFGWEVSAERVVPVADLVQAVVASILAFSDRGDGVVVQTPIYPPFLGCVDDTGRATVLNPLVDDGARWAVDVDGLRQAGDARTRVLLLCNPHNPSGRVLDRDELLGIGRVAVERDLVIVSDEIHCDLVYPGARHVPVGSLDAEIAARAITLNSATKVFNIAGLRCGVMHFGSDALLDRFRRAIPSRLLGAVSSIGLDATVAAWREAQPWLDAVLVRLLANRDRVAGWAAGSEGVHHHPPQATYLALLDLGRLELPAATPSRFFLDEARVALGPGAGFGLGGGTSVPLNFATSPEVLEAILGRMTAALQDARERSPRA